MSEVVLYRKYRSKTFDEVVGQKHVVLTLKNAIKSGQVGHAYLFSGPRGVGKTSVARILSRAVNCLNLGEGGNPCNVCEVCQSFVGQSSLDLIEIDAASHRGIDSIRSLQEGVGFAPSAAKKKVFIIDEVHMLTKEAFNALLKTLEEPPPHAIFILATTELEKVPETIVSRCQHFTFSRLGNHEISIHLMTVAKNEGKKLQKSAADMIAEGVRGSVRDALSVLEQLLLVESQSIGPDDVMVVLGLVEESLIYEIFTKLIKSETTDALNTYYERVYNQGIDVWRFMKACQIFLRKMILIKSGIKFESEVLVKMAGQVDIEFLVGVLDILEDVLQKKYEIDSLYFEVFVCRVGMAVGPSLSEKKTSIVDKKNNEGFDPNISKKVIESNTEKNDQNKKMLAKEVVESSVEPEPDNKAVLTREVIEEKWENYLREINSIKPVLGSILKMCIMCNVTADTVELDVPFAFHKQKLDDAKNRELLLAELSKTYHQKINIKINVKQNSEDITQKKKNIEKQINKQVNEATGNNVVNDVIKIFGGKIVENGQ